MNIGILIPGFSADEHDWCIPVYLDLVRELAKNYHVRVFPIRYPHTTFPYEVYGALVFPFDGGSYTSGIRRWQMLWGVEQNIKGHHQVLRFDVLHAIWADETGYIANRIGRQIGVPTVVSVAGGELVGFPEIKYGLQLGRVTSWLVYQSVKHATQLVAPSLYSAEMLHGYMTYHQLGNTGRINHVPLGTNTDMFTLPDDPKAPRPREFLHVGSLIPVKRQDLLLELIAKMPGATLDIIGEGNLRVFLEKRAEVLGIADRVVFHGHVQHHDLPPFYQSARYLLMTSQHEAFCMAAIEAMACGAGVIGTGVGVLPEIGEVTPIGDMDRLLAKIVSRKRTATLESYTSRRELIKQSYSLKNMVDGLVKVYEQAIELGR
jgi:glycosyltransferase involved in cell wall biosynthesis